MNLIKSGPKQQTPKQKANRGNPSKRKINTNFPKPTLSTSPMQAPLDLPDDVRAVWHRLAPELHAQDCLTTWDTDLFRIYCKAVVEEREEALYLLEHGKTFVAHNGYESPSPHVAFRNKAAENVARYGSLFGLNPTARGSMDISAAAAQSDADDDFACGVGK